MVYKNMFLTKKFKNKTTFAISIGVILQWLSLFLSYRKLPDAYQKINTPIATGGFPFKIFEYPPSPMGNDWPPIETWPMFFLNTIIWIIVGFLIALLLNKKIQNKIVAKFSIAFAVSLSVLGLFYIMINFD